MRAPLPTHVGPYRIDALVEDDGRARTYEATDERLKRRVTMKVLGAADERTRTRFHREARVLMRVEHPNVVMLHDYTGEEEAEPYIVTERLEGLRASEAVRAKGAIPAEVAVAIVGQIARGLAALHAEGLVHRDIGLRAIDLEPSGVALLAELGLAAATNARSDTLAATASTQATANAHGIAPELLDDAPATPASDVYALLVALAHALRGSPPLKSEHAGALLEAIRARRFVRLADRGVPAPIARLVDATLATARPEDRPSASALAEQLERFAGGDPRSIVAAWLAQEKLIARSSEEVRTDTDAALAAGDERAAFVLVTGGRYENLRPLGQGAMGTVFAGRDTRLQRDVAIKLIRGDADEEARMRFHREARALGRLRHPAIVEVLDYGGRDARLPYLVLELIDGVTLDRLLKVSLLPPDVAACVAIAIAEALALVHQNAIVHRDLKPQNVFVDHEGRVVLGDFGIARGLEQKTGTFVRGDTKAIGSPLFASPEQVLNPDSVDGRSDLFSLGALMHALITGESPFAAATPMDVLRLVTKGDHAALPAAIDRDYRAIVERLLVPDMSVRAADAGAIAAALREYLTAARVVDPRAHLARFLHGESEGTQVTRIAAARGETAVAHAAAGATASLTVPATVPATAPTRAATEDEASSRWLMWFAIAATATAVGAGAVLLPRVLAKRPPPRIEVATPAPPLAPPPEPGAGDALPLPEPPPNDAVPAPTPLPDEARDRPRPRKPTPAVPAPATPARRAFVQFVVTPWAKILIDGIPFGTTPVFHETELEPGRHVVRFENPKMVTKEIVLQLAAGERREVPIRLEKP